MSLRGAAPTTYQLSTVLSGHYVPLYDDKDNVTPEVHGTIPDGNDAETYALQTNDGGATYVRYDTHNPVNPGDSIGLPHVYYRLDNQDGAVNTETCRKFVVGYQPGSPGVTGNIHWQFRDTEATEAVYFTNVQVVREPDASEWATYWLQFSIDDGDFTDGSNAFINGDYPDNVYQTIVIDPETMGPLIDAFNENRLGVWMEAQPSGSQGGGEDYVDLSYFQVFWGPFGEDVPTPDPTLLTPALSADLGDVGARFN